MALAKSQGVQNSAVIGLPARAEAVARLNTVSVILNQGLAWLAAGSLLLMVFLVVVNAVVRKISAPFTGTPEIVGWLAALTTGFGLGYTQVHRGYVEIDALVERLPRGMQKALKRFMLFVSMCFFSLVSWQIVLYGLTVMKNGNLSETMWLPFYPLIFLLGLGFAGLSLAILVDFLKELNGGAGK